MSMIEFQISTASFLSMQRNILRATKFCPPPPFPVGPVNVLIDHVDFGSNALRHYIPDTFPIFYQEGLERVGVPNAASGFRTQVAQDVTVYATTLEEVLAHPNGTPTLVAVTGTVVFELNLDVRLDGDVWYRVAYDHVELAPAPGMPPVLAGQLAQAVSLGLAQLIPSRSSPLGLSSVLPKDVLFTNAGISVDSQSQRLALRVEIGGRSTNADVPWTNFLSGYIADRLQGLDWSLFVDAGEIRETVKALVNLGIASAGTIDHLQTFVDCTYSNAGGKAVFTLDVLGIYDLPDPMGVGEVEAHVPMELSVPSPNIVSVDADFSSVVEIILSFVNLVGMFIPPLASALNSFARSLIGTALNEGAAAVKEDAPVDTAQVEGNHIIATRGIRVWDLLSAGSARLTQVLALEDGPALAGTLHMDELTNGTIRTTVHPFAWNPPSIHCGASGIGILAAFTAAPADWALLHADAYVESTGTTPRFLCSVAVLNDPLGVFPANRIRSDWGQTTFHLMLDLPVPGNPYYNAPYDCDLLVTTTGGVRLLRIAQPARFTQADVAKLEAVLLAKIADCERLMDGWLHGHGYNPRWAVNPPPGELAVEHLWQVEVGGLVAGDKVSLIGGAEKLIAQGTAREGSALRLSAMLPPSAGGELTILHGAGGRPAGNEAQAPRQTTVSPADNAPESARRTQGISVGQRLLLRRGAISLAAPLRSIQATPFMAARGALAVVEDAVIAFELAAPERPAMIGFWRIPGVRGALYLQGRLLAYGEHGFSWIDEAGRMRAHETECEFGAIRAAAIGAKDVYALCGNSAAVLSHALCRRGEIPADGVSSLAVTADRLVLGGGNGVATRTLSRSRHDAFWHGGEVREVRRPIGYEAGTILATLRDGSARLLRLEEHGIEEIASYPVAPWFARAARIGNLLLTAGPDAQTLILHQFGESTAI